MAFICMNGEIKEQSIQHSPTGVGLVMRLNREVLSKLLERAFDLGQDSSYELKSQVVDEIVWNVQKDQEEPWVVMPVKELSSLPSGRKLFHSVLGEGVITIKNGERYVQFAGFRMELSEEGWPWTEKLQVIS